MAVRRSPHLLLVDDNISDAHLFREVLRESRFGTSLHAVENGEDALRYLSGQGRFANAPRPDLILLDLNMPRQSGHDVLANLKQDPDLAAIPVIVLSTSCREEEVRQSYRLGAACHLQKPEDLSALMHLVQALEGFWCGFAVFPETRRVSHGVRPAA